MRRFKPSTIQLFSILLVAGFMMSSIVLSYTIYSSQSRDALIKAINRSDKIDEDQTQRLLNVTLGKADRNYEALVNATNTTNQLINYLTENFGAQSGYLQREDFQYQQANKTFTFLEEAIKNQRKGLEQQNIIISNQHNIIENQQKILNQTAK